MNKQSEVSIQEIPFQRPLEHTPEMSPISLNLFEDSLHKEIFWRLRGMFEGYFLWNFLWNHLHVEIFKRTWPKKPVEVGIWSPLFAILPRHPGEYLFEDRCKRGPPFRISWGNTHPHQVFGEFGMSRVWKDLIYFRPRKMPGCSKVWINSSVLKFKLTKDARGQVKFIKYPPKN